MTGKFEGMEPLISCIEIQTLYHSNRTTSLNPLGFLRWTR